MTLRLDDQDEHHVADLQEAWGLSKQEVIKRALRESAAREGHASAVAQATDASLARWAELLDRLA